MRLGVIADDFTGATDIAGFLVGNGMRTIMFNGVPDQRDEFDADALVVSMKIRSCPVPEAVDKALEALQFLQAAKCDRFYFKYCSTFDSTHEGNIGPITDALMARLDTSLTLICPALPINGRTVYKGYLFVNDQLLSESSMRHHPITPMQDAKLCRLMEGQFKGSSTHIHYEDMAKGPQHIRHCIETARSSNANYLIVDVLEEAQLHAIAEATEDFPLVTGGSGLAIGMAHLHNLRLGKQDTPAVSFLPRRLPAVVIAGSCSQRTNEQVALYRTIAQSRYIEESQCLENPQYAQELADWVLERNNDLHAPMVYATKTPQDLEKSKQMYGDSEVSARVEQVIGTMTSILATRGIKNYLIAGGETSGVVATVLGLSAYLIGIQIDPGVSWIRSLDGEIQLVYKSGNFGTVDFFKKAQELYDNQS